MPFEIVRNEITNVKADAIVNTANPRVTIGHGVDQSIYEAAGIEELLAARAEIGEMKRGEVAATPAFGLDAKYIIHAIGPKWRGGGHGEFETIAACYSKSLALAAELGCESIAFPLMATGSYGFPKDKALRTAVNEISKFLLHNEMQVTLVVYDRESYEVSGRLFSDIQSFIEDSDVVLPDYRRGHRRRNEAPVAYSIKESPDIETPDIAGETVGSVFEAPPSGEDFEASLDAEMDVLIPPPGAEEAYGELGGYTSLEERMEHMDKTFQEYLFMLIDRKGLKDSDVYKNANIDRKLFSKIRSDKFYQPAKKTVLALAIGMKLNVDETRDLLLRAGYALSNSILFDMIIRHCIEKGEYNIYDINCVLFDYDQPQLGA